ncbi:MAG: adenylate kinase [Bacteroidales bacterium]|jgi:adenylate kinase|nr:adenylate kinase [Bacteroidales bacterium]
MLNIALFGAPGAGKGTQSKMLIEKYNLTYIATGDILRQEIAAQTELGLQAKDIINKGGLVPDELIVQIIEKIIERDEQNNNTGGILFDGFPRTVVQAYILEGMLHRLNRRLLCMLSLDVPKDELIRRMLDRATKENRSDDNEEVIHNRLNEYHNKTMPVADFYSEKGIYCPVNGIGSVDEVFARLTSEIEQSLQKAYRNILLYGAPGAGKGTQAKMLAEKYDLVYVSTGTIIREEIEKQTDVGKICQPYVEAGDNVPDEIAIRLIEKKINEHKTAKGFIFKGYPSSYIQAYIMDGILDRIHSSVTCMVELKANPIKCVKRLNDRNKTDKRRIYDRDTDIIIHRLDNFEKSSGKVRAYYQNKNKYYCVDAEQDVEIVFTNLCNTIDEALRKS